MIAVVFFFHFKAWKLPISPMLEDLLFSYPFSMKDHPSGNTQKYLNSVFKRLVYCQPIPGSRRIRQPLSD
jgi:hypothetical protein